MYMLKIVIFLLAGVSASWSRTFGWLRRMPFPLRHAQTVFMFLKLQAPAACDGALQGSERDWPGCGTLQGVAEGSAPARLGHEPCYGRQAGTIVSNGSTSCSQLNATRSLLQHHLRQLHCVDMVRSNQDLSASLYGFA